MIVFTAPVAKAEPKAEKPKPDLTPRPNSPVVGPNKAKRTSSRGSPEHIREYQRDYMRRRRALAKGEPAPMNVMDRNPAEIERQRKLAVAREALAKVTKSA
jgi:hypothetical protein